MSIEVLMFFLRVLGGLVLAGFLLALFYIIWRGFSRAANALDTVHARYGRLVSVGDHSGDHHRGKSFSLLPVTTLGRSSSNAIVVDDDYASALHATIMMAEGQWWIEDRGSRNGTQLNDQRIRQRTALVDGDIIGIGRFTYKLVLTK